MSDITKRAIELSLKQVLEDKPLDKVTINDITKNCGINRMTFYYHFSDIYDLIEWIFTNDAQASIEEKKTYSTWQEGFLKIFNNVLKNKNFIYNVYHSLSREQVEKYLYKLTYEFVRGVIEELACGMIISEDDKRFIADFYKYAFVGLVLNWISKNMKEDPKKIIDRLSILVQGDIIKALNALRLDKVHK